MLKRFASALVGVALLCFPAYAENSAWDDAVTKAPRFSGLWVATPDQVQSLVFPAELPPITRLFLNIHTRIRRDGDAVEITIAEARLDLEENWGTASPMYLYDQVVLGNPVPGNPLTIVGDGVDFRGQCCSEASTKIT